MAAAAAGNAVFHHDGNTGQAGVASRTAEFRPVIPASGRYQVFATWIPDPANSANVHFNIHHAGSSLATPLSVDQREPAYEGVCLGEFYFAAGQSANGRVVVENRFDPADGESIGRVVIDTVRWVRVPTWEQAIDESDAGTPAGTPPHAVATGQWSAGTSNGVERLGPSHQNDGNPVTKGTRSYLFTPNLPRAGFHSVYLWWPEGTSSSSQTPVEVITPAGVVLAPAVNQRVGGGRWNFLGKYWLAPGTGGVRLKNVGANGFVIADGVLFLRGDDGDEDGIPEEWESFYGLNDAVAGDAELDADGDGQSNRAEYLAGSDPGDFFNGSPPHLNYVSGSGQTSDLAAFAPQPLVLEVRESGMAGAPLMLNVPVPVTFQVESGGGFLADTPGVPATQTALTVWTDPGTGRAQVYFQQPNTHGTVSVVRAQAGMRAGASNTVNFTLHTHLLAGAWAFDEASGAQVLDASPSQPPNHGMLSASGALREPSFKFRVPGPDNAVRLDGVAGSVSVPHSPTLALTNAPVSVGAWVHLAASVPLESTARNYPILAKWSVGGGGFELSVRGGSANGLAFRIFAAGAVISELTPLADLRASLADGKPHWVAWTRNAQNVGRLYLDGTEVASATGMGASLNSSTALVLGANSAGQHLPGALEDVRLLASTLRADEVLNAFSSDGDTLPDWWEMKHFGNLAPVDTGDDDTGGADGLTNRQEYERNTNPAQRDTDNDGLADGDEVAAGFNPVQAAVLDATGQHIPLSIHTPLE